MAAIFMFFVYFWQIHWRNMSFPHSYSDKPFIDHVRM